MESLAAVMDAPAGPVPRLLRFFFTDPTLAAKYPKGLAVPLGINRDHVPSTLSSLCGGNAAGTCYGNATEASKADVLGFDLGSILQYVEDDTWSNKGGGKALRTQGFVVVEGELHVVFQHYTPTSVDGGGPAANDSRPPGKIGRTNKKSKKEEKGEDPPFTSIELEYLNIAFRHWPRDLTTGAPLTKTGGNGLPPAPECYRKFCMLHFFKLLKENNLDRRQSASKIKSFFGTKASTEAAWLLGPTRKKPPPSEGVRDRAKQAASIWHEAYGAAFKEKRVPPMMELRDELAVFEGVPAVAPLT
mmetsp:Transcript_29945/g.75426  ORF Transcript_29945/g.75426 Transcript_29945/m.75426 type:complete len:302 (-) Transcript_29945:149-1054(-)|eukprot:jgi/Tetstr1/457779/TSEL_044324.t1